MNTSLSKKLLAGLLSLVMVLSLVAPSMGTQAASKYSLTDKKSVKAGVTFKYQLKGVSKNQYVKVTRNVSGETVKYNKEAVSKTTKINGTGKTLNLYVTYGEKAENYTGKFTVKVYSKKTNKVAKTLVEKVTVKVSELPSNQVEGVVKLADRSGLQSDGTALLGDVIAVEIPATIGSYKDVIFYRDGKQLNSTTSTYSNNAIAADVAGTYSASVITNDGKVYLSDTIKVVEEEAKAVIKSFTIEDDYQTAGNITLDAADANAVVTVTLNKLYKGTIGIFNTSDLKFLNSVEERKTELTGSEFSNAAPTYGVNSVVLCKSMPSNQLVIAENVSRNNAGCVYVYRNDMTGEATYKFLTTVGNSLVRGTEYKVAFDQNKITTDSFGNGSENVGPATATCNYVEVPASLEVQSVSNGSPIVIKFLDKEGHVLTWMGNNNEAVSNFLSELKVFSDTDNDGKDGTNLGATAALSKVNKGVCTTNAKGTSAAFYYATAKAKSGIFGKTAVDITSNIGNSAQEAASYIGIAQDKKDPYSAKVSFSNLRTDGTLYIMQSYDDETKEAKEDDAEQLMKAFMNGTQTVKASTEVKAGTKEVTVSSAIDAIDATGVKNAYIAIFVPTDTVNFGTVYTKDDHDSSATGARNALLVKQTLVDVKLSQSTVADEKVWNDKQYVIKGVDQFGDEMTLDAMVATNTKSNIVGDDVVPTIAITASTGVVTIAGASGAKVGATYSATVILTIGTQKITKTFDLTCPIASDKFALSVK